MRMCPQCGGPKRPHVDGMHCSKCDRMRGRIVVHVATTAERIERLTDPQSRGKPLDPIRGGLLS